MARSSLSKVEYRVSMADSFFEKNDNGLQPLLLICCITAPTCVDEASTARDTLAEAEGCARDVAEASAALADRNDCSKESVHTSFLGLPLRASVRGRSVPAIPGKKRR